MNLARSTNALACDNESKITNQNIENMLENLSYFQKSREIKVTQ